MQLSEDRVSMYSCASLWQGQQLTALGEGRELSHLSSTLLALLRCRLMILKHDEHRLHKTSMHGRSSGPADFPARLQHCSIFCWLHSAMQMWYCLSNQAPQGRSGSSSPLISASPNAVQWVIHFGA